MAYTLKHVPSIPATDKTLTANTLLWQYNYYEACHTQHSHNAIYPLTMTSTDTPQAQPSTPNLNDSLGVEHIYMYQDM